MIIRRGFTVIEVIVVIIIILDAFGVNID
ncbi:prepilin-type N-terminal cleavage/methylation domain-containing protein [uncultured Ilyobacter sp.]